MAVGTNPNATASRSGSMVQATCTHDRDWYVEVATHRVFRRPCTICDTNSWPSVDRWVADPLARAS